ncbi:ribokinase [Oceanobacillus sp. FSL K6-2867]|uniref:ribokinase n=1 Tax=Oceanobacillus sp. FSL K6-2867 TaxID=2954748 RepID=UPI0030DCDEE9
MEAPKITIVGSINMDLMTSVPRIPEQGETLLANSFIVKPGGKGANQAVAAARLGADVTMIGKVGSDSFGIELREQLEKEGIDIQHVEVEHATSTGIANIILYENDNRIMVVPGANEYVTPKYVEQNKSQLLHSDLVLMQLEIPIETIVWCANFCFENNIPIIINPAPALDLPEEIWRKCKYITPNEEEAIKLFGTNIDDYEDSLITTLGSRGARYKDNIVPSFPTNVVDTTGVGDTFNGALATYIASGLDINDAILKANIAASLAIEKAGAQEGMPTWEQVEGRCTE